MFCTVRKYKPFEIKKEPIKQSLVLIGGDGSGYDYGESDWYRLAFEFQNINTTFINSRRTPKFAWQNLKENSGKNHFYHNSLTDVLYHVYRKSANLFLLYYTYIRYQVI